jgi:hypothetical protein
MHTTGAAAKTAAVFFVFMIVMVICLRNNMLCFIAAGGNSGTCYAGQHQQVNAEYEQDCFHAAKIMAYVLILMKQDA